MNKSALVSNFGYSEFAIEIASVVTWGDPDADDRCGVTATAFTIADEQHSVIPFWKVFFLTVISMCS